ncbi:MAG: hypothetical protein E5Y89_21230 [Mesorhizobium sp.]|uniref:hypothetical protein n=1 Tax=Mesorhizobium sp. M4A.F.Ca.ET.022.05.2.1 TaxID=2496653 RepID=UPI000FCAD6FF|nr:hypothetical protein [Mesorhizobium sp. M4A.F.Ca.ET.022.05.2.1]RVC78221.1 hypothetical protein EN745_19550 [Mesorhizobium sp. M4A.F.Ca.ET.022.05.2.1]TIL73553.1 MAG: hypothetical protein E5Y89_21230 [Mesorhizobium sp.]
MSFPPVLGAPLRRNDHFEHSYFYLKNISTDISALPGGINSLSDGSSPPVLEGISPQGEEISRHCGLR